MLHLIEKPETIIALVSLLVSVATFIFVYLRPPKTSTFLGPTVLVGYTLNGSGFSVQLPVTFINNGAKAGSVFRTAILLHHHDSPNQQYFMQWDTFMKLDAQQLTPRWVHEELAHVLMIPANSSVAKLILFAWNSASQPALKIREGVYDLEFFFWSDDTTLPRYETHQISISPDDRATLEDRSDPANLRSVILQLDEQLETNKFKNEFDARAVRKQKLKNPA
jgi:hypothetical protein